MSRCHPLFKAKSVRFNISKIVIKVLFRLLNSCLFVVCRYEKIYEEVQSLEPVHVFHGWMRVDGRSMKSALLNIVKKWSFMFKQHLVDHVTNR